MRPQRPRRIDKKALISPPPHPPMPPVPHPTPRTPTTFEKFISPFKSIFTKPATKQAPDLPQRRIDFQGRPRPPSNGPAEDFASIGTPPWGSKKLAPDFFLRQSQRNRDTMKVLQQQENHQPLLRRYGRRPAGRRRQHPAGRKIAQMQSVPVERRVPAPPRGVPEMATEASTSTTTTQATTTTTETMERKSDIMHPLRSRPRKKLRRYNRRRLSTLGLGFDPTNVEPETGGFVPIMRNGGGNLPALAFSVLDEENRSEEPASITDAPMRVRPMERPQGSNRRVRNVRNEWNEVIGAERELFLLGQSNMLSNAIDG